MRRGWKILIGVGVALAVLLALNTVIVDHETKPAAVTEPGGRLLKLPGGELEVVEKGPKNAGPIVLIHCFTCAINWWDKMIPLLARDHRVVAVDLLGHGGSEKPASGYSITNQADLVAQALGRLGVSNAEVVGHSLGGPVTIALAEQSPDLVSRMVTIDSIPDTSYGDVGLIGELPFKPVIGEALWRIKPDFSIRDGLGVAFAPGYDVPDAFVEDVKRMTYSAYTGSHDAFDEYTSEKSLPERAAAIGKPLLAIMGAEEQIASDPSEALAAYRAAYPATRTKLIAGAGHSPNVEKPAETAALVLGFANTPLKGVGSKARGGVGSAEVTPGQKPKSGQNRARMPFPGTDCKKACNPKLPSGPPRTVEPMFDTTKTSLPTRLADAADLAIDFATLGEYGLEPVDAPSRPCESRHRAAARTRSAGTWRSAIDRFATQP